MKNTLLVMLATAALLPAQVATQANERYQTEQGRAAVAKGLDAPDRDQKQRPVELVKSLGIKPGMTVAEAERRLIYETLTYTENNKTRAAEMLAISLKTLHNKLKEYEAEPQS